MPPTSSPSPQLFFETLNAYQRSAALKTAIELKLFTAIAAGHDTPVTIAAACQIVPRGARILADYLAILGFLTKSADRYALTPDSAMFLDIKSPAYLGGAVEFLSSTHMRDRFDALTAAVRNGGAPTEGNSLEPNHDSWVHFARGMAGIMIMPAKALAQRLLGDNATAPMKVLDIAAGHGLFGIAFATQNPNATIVASDWANVLEVARENAQKAGVGERCQLLPGSAFEVDFGTGYDLVLLTNFLHHFNESTNIALLKKVHAALKPGGRAVALEFSPDDTRLNPPGSGAFAMIMLATTPAGDAFTFTEYRRMFTAAGFAKTDCSDLEGTMQQVVIGQK